MTGGTSLQMYPGAILGSPAAQRDLVASGAADVALVIAFPMATALPPKGSDRSGQSRSISDKQN